MFVFQSLFTTIKHDEIALINLSIIFYPKKYLRPKNNYGSQKNVGQHLCCVSTKHYIELPGKYLYVNKN